MRDLRANVAAWLGIGLSLLVTGCGGSGSGGSTTAATYVLSLGSTNSVSSITIGVSPADNSGTTTGTPGFTLTYNAGTTVTLTAPATAVGFNNKVTQFLSWTGCTRATTTTCTVTLNANTSVTANYAASATYMLTVNSTDPASGVMISENDTVDGLILNGTTSFAASYPIGRTLILTAPATAGGNTFTSWSGCNSTSTTTCTVTLNANTTVTANYATPPQYTLMVNSTNPASGVPIFVGNPYDNAGQSETTSFTITSDAGSQYLLSAPGTAGSNTFSSWTGCTSASTTTCDVTLNGNMTVTANHTVPAVAVTPNPATVTLGATQQFAAALNGAASSAVTWSVAAPTGSSLSPGTINSSGLYTTPYPAPATVTVTATSTQDTTKSGSVTVTLSPPATAAGPALTVNVSSPGNAISPDIYGMDAYLLHATTADATAAAQANISVNRWGGDSTERYNYQLDVTNSIADWYFENVTGNAGDGWPAVSGVKAFDALVASNSSNGIKTVGTVPVLGWVAKDSSSCSFPATLYASQYAFDPYNSNCGDGKLSNQTDITGNSAAITSIAEPPPTPPGSSAAATTAWADATWTGSWVEYLVGKFGSGGSGTGVAIYDLDNEPSWWDSNDFDVHPLPFTYDEVTNGGIGTALAIKTVDSTALVSGPVMDWWWDYFYSKKDVEAGWSTGPCWQPWSNPTDRAAHGGTPLIEYYLQQFAAAETTYGKRLLDYLDLHTYFGAQYPTNSGHGVGLTTAGDTGEQQARLNSTRAFWDSTYTDPDTFVSPAYGGYQQPNYITDSNYTTSCTVPAQAPRLIPLMKTWVANDYPGTKTAIDEYNWGGMESINGALAQADILGIFGREGLNLATMWPTTNPSQQIPGMMAFAIYRNYDGSKSTFGDTVLSSTSANQGRLSIYGARRSSDSAVTVVVINKTYGDLTSTLSLTGLNSSTTTAQACLYSGANLAAIVAQPAVTVTPPASGGTTSTISNYTFPAQSITLFVVSQ